MSDYLCDKQAKEAIIDIGKRIYAHGFIASNDGNISCKVSDNEVWCTPTGVSKGFMTEDMLVKMDLDGNIIEGTYKGTSEIKMHFRVFKENPQVHSVVHAHPPIATAFAIAGLSLEDPILVEGILALGSVPLVHYGTPGTNEIPDGVAPYCKDYNAVLLANHGALTWGQNIIQAYYRMETLEYYAKVTLLTKFIIGRANELSKDQVNEIIKIRTSGGVTGGGVPVCKDVATNMEDIVKSLI